MADLVKKPELVKALIVTVGTSALMADQSDKRPDLNDRHLPGDARLFIADVQDGGVDSERATEIEKRLIAEHRNYWASPNALLASRLRNTSAELSSTLQLVDSHGYKPERLLLICTLTEDGLMAGRVNQTLFQEQAGKLLPASVTVDLLKEPDRGDDFLTWLRRLEEMVGGAAAAQLAIVNITGGFKGLAPTMTMLAIRRGWWIFYRHEVHMDRG